MERITFDGNFCDIAQCANTPGGSFCEDGFCLQRKVWERLKEYENAEEQGRLVALPRYWLETLKLLTISAICYKENINIITSKIKDSKEIAELFFQLPTVQYCSNSIKLESLLDSKIDVNNISSVNEIVDIFYHNSKTEDTP